MITTKLRKDRRVKRFKRLMISTDFLALILRGGLRPFKTDAPADLEIVRVHQTADDEVNGVVQLIVHSDNFHPVETGKLIPQMEPIKFQTTNDKPKGESHGD